MGCEKVQVRPVPIEEDAIEMFDWPEVAKVKETVPVAILTVVVVLPPLKEIVLPDRLKGAFTAREVDATPIGQVIVSCTPVVEA